MSRRERRRRTHQKRRAPSAPTTATTALRHAADARAEVKSSEVLAGGSRLAAMRARLDEQAAPPSLKATSGVLGWLYGGGKTSRTKPDDDGDDSAASGLAAPSKQRH